MKKAYIKPIIEENEFSPNEYIAACYFVTCQGTGGKNAHGFYLTSLPVGQNLNVNGCPYTYGDGCDSKSCSSSDNDDIEYSIDEFSNNPENIPYYELKWSGFSDDDWESIYKPSSTQETGLTTTAVAS